MPSFKNGASRFLVGILNLKDGQTPKPGLCVASECPLWVVDSDFP
jgi:hypothetical protein